jgi:hypothetical protein
MKAKTSDPNQNCFSFPDGYSLSLANTSTIDFETAFGAGKNDGGGSAIAPPVF